ncbi:alpha/beta hydrolase [Fontivita pretiosa]|uniref:alpha/beta hydrolase n=1 Tax=Fontivita pretiosa TaxID=2989684 RepID=UPI003D182C32
MSICQIHWFSKVLDKTVATTVILPDAGRPPFATYYLLHGLSDDHTIWHRRTRIEWYVRQLPLMVVMPDGYRGFYTNISNGPAYARYISEELVGFIQRTFPARASRAARCIGGLSMGGYGALRAALAYPHLYASANSHSGALMHGSKTWPRSNGMDRSDVFGADPRGTDHDLLHLAARAGRQRPLPRLLIDCGTDDFLLKDNREFHLKLEALGVEHEYWEYPGGHDWDYWDNHVRDAIAFHAKVLKLKPFRQ